MSKFIDESAIRVNRICRRIYKALPEAIRKEREGRLKTAVNKKQWHAQPPDECAEATNIKPFHFGSGKSLE